MFKILFICTDNMARSLTAEHLLKDRLRKSNRNDIEVSSAGTDVDSDISSFCMAHLDRLGEMGIDVSGHKRTQVTKEILEDCDLVITMEEEHRNWIKKKFDGFEGEAMLYNELYKNEKSDVRISPPGSQGSMEGKLVRMIEYFEGSMTEIVDEIDNMNKNKKGL